MRDAACPLSTRGGGGGGRTRRPSRGLGCARTPAPACRGAPLRASRAAAVPRSTQAAARTGDAWACAREGAAGAGSPGALRVSDGCRWRPVARPPPPPPPPRTKWTRRVPHPVLIGHAVCLVQVRSTPHFPCYACRIGFSQARLVEVQACGGRGRPASTRRTRCPAPTPECAAEATVGRAKGRNGAETPPPPRTSLARECSARSR